jgi:hypothetical protein
LKYAKLRELLQEENENVTRRLREPIRRLQPIRNNCMNTSLIDESFGGCGTSIQM